MSLSPTSSRRQDSRSSGEIEVEGGVRRRRRGAARLSCAECRRLKLRCDRKIPCDSCVKRGCGAICPDGSLTTGKGNRFVLASTQELHEKISELCNRVRELEDGLRESHRQLSDDQHPLLTDELLRVKMPLQRETPTERPSNVSGEEETESDVVDSFGSLSISPSGRTKYYGQFANSWYYLQNEQIDEEPSDERGQSIQSVLPREILALGTAFPSSPTSSPNGLETDRFRSLSWYLPMMERASSLREIYFQRAAWMYNPIPQPQFDEQVFSHLYGGETLSPVDDSAGSHRLAVMFMILAIGSLLDPQIPPYNLDAEKYYHLARAALFQHSTFDEPTLHAVQALFLMTFYLFLFDRHGTSSGSRWIIMGMAVKLAQSIGLHRDSTRWGVEAEETLRRREIFWELYTYDSWQCLTFGRPPSFSLTQVDCKFPYPSDDPTGDKSFNTWKHRFSSECMSVVHDRVFGAKPPNYQTVLQLDRKLRAFPVPPMLQIVGFGTSSTDPAVNNSYPESTPLILQRHIVLAIRETNLIYMHRGFFARAISDHPKDPLGSPYGTSVIAAYRSAGSLVALIRNLNSQLPEPTERLWFLWAHLFSCAIVLGSIVTRCPAMSIAPSALVQLDSACELFEKVAKTFRADRVLRIMLRLREKAHFALNEFREGRGSPQQRRGDTSMGDYTDQSGSPLEEEDELSVLGGKTRLNVSKDHNRARSTSPSPNDLSPSIMNSVVPLPLASTGGQVHPSVLEYLQSFPPQRGMQQSTAINMTYPSSQLDPPPSAPYNMVAFQQDIPQQSVDQVLNMAQQQQSGPPPHPQIQTSTTAQTNSLPQYFHVYDYGSANNDAGFGYVTNPQLSPTMPYGVQSNGGSYPSHVNAYDGGQIRSGVQRESLTPEETMQSSWMDFVAQMSTMSG